MEAVIGRQYNTAPMAPTAIMGPPPTHTGVQPAAPAGSFVPQTASAAVMAAAAMNGYAVTGQFGTLTTDRYDGNGSDSGLIGLFKCFSLYLVTKIFLSCFVYIILYFYEIFSLPYKLKAETV